jgi:hypothetical protein
MSTLLALASVVSVLFWPAKFPLKYDTPAGWVAVRASSPMRVVEFTLPRAAGDAEDGALAVFFFGGRGGNAQANVDRWIGQMAQPDGRPSKDRAVTTNRKTRGGLAVTLVDVPGIYIAEVTPGAAERHNKPNFRLRAAIVESREGPYFVKLTGPAGTVARWDDSFLAFLDSLRLG